ncbi:hypothetical protein YTPLAS73_12130 [Nitrosarchaeum sp.]|nr:hypothetical protein YTPLAS73_12130 [Nitrosarchaeum sp.]
MGLFGSTQSEEEKRQKDLEKLAKETAESNKKVRLQEVKERIDQYKPSWDKNGVIQYKNEHIAILQRMWGQQVEFIIAFDDLTKEGYRCIAHDEGKEGGSGGGFTGGVNSYFYFQKIEFVR